MICLLSVSLTPKASPFQDQHFPKYSNGTLFLQHAQSCETWPDCDNPAAQIAALIRITEGLTSIPRHLVPAEQAAFFARIAKSLPAIPLTDAKNGQPQISPCDGGFPSRHVNGENVETCKIVILSRFVVLSVSLTQKVSLFQSAGTGAMAAMDAERWLCEHGC